VNLVGDGKNGGHVGVTKGIEEAAAAIGWTVKTIDGAGSVAGRTAAVGVRDRPSPLLRHSPTGRAAGTMIFKAAGESLPKSRQPTSSFIAQVRKREEATSSSRTIFFGIARRAEMKEAAQPRRPLALLCRYFGVS